MSSLINESTTYYDSFFEENDSTTIHSSYNQSNYNFLETCDNSVFEIFILSALVFFCVIAMSINMAVIISVHWIRRPMTPIIKLSLSLAVADTCCSCIFGMVLFAEIICYSFVFLHNISELIRLCSIVITVAHLLALSLNHYIGILKPLHYDSIVSARRVTVAICSIWLIPASIVIIICILENGFMFWKEFGSAIMVFMSSFVHRLSYSLLFFIPIVLMAFFYIHILLIVMRQQMKWRNLSRLGSTRWRGTCRQSSDRSVSQDRRVLDGNIKAMYTTFLIMGSCIIGWMPAVLMFIIICDDCYIQGQNMEKLNSELIYFTVTLRFTEQLFLIMKSILNPIIYSIRMREIVEGRNRMYLAITNRFCPAQPHNNFDLVYQHSPLRQESTTVHVRLNSLRHNGNSHHHINGKLDPSQNTFL